MPEEPDSLRREAGRSDGLKTPDTASTACEPARPLRIAFVAYRGNMNCGGQGIYLWFLARELTRLGHTVEVFVGPPYVDPMPWAEEVHELPNRGFWGLWFLRRYDEIASGRGPHHPLLPLNFYEMTASMFGFLPEPFAFSVRAFSALAAEMRRGARWDLVHDVQCLGWGLLGVRALGLPVVTTIHHPLTVDRRTSFQRDTNLREAIGTMAFYPVGMQSRVARSIDRVLTSSEVSARQIAGDFGVAPERIRNVSNGLDTELYCPDPAAKENPREVLCVGRASDPNKGIKLAIDMLARLPADVRLTLVDSDDPENTAFRWAAAAGVSARMTVTGRISTERLVELYRRAAVTVVPSRYEGFGLPAVESMACGTPAVTSDAGALPEVVGAAGGGIVVPKDDLAALVAAVGGLLADGPRRLELGLRGRRRVAERFSWASVARTTVAAYREVLAEARGLPASTTTSASVGATRATASAP